MFMGNKHHPFQRVTNGHAMNAVTGDMLTVCSNGHCHVVAPAVWDAEEGVGVYSSRRDFCTTCEEQVDSREFSDLVGVGASSEAYWDWSNAYPVAECLAAKGNS